MNFEEWFLSEFGKYGFSLTITMYDIDTFAPCKLVVLPNGLRSRIKIIPELSDDLRGWGAPSYERQVEDLRELIRMELRRLHPEFFISPSFTPIKKINKLSFT